MQNVMHHAGLKNILEKLIIVDGAASFDLKNPALANSMCVSVKALQYLAFASKEHRNNYLVFAGLPFLDAESDFFQPWAEPRHNGVAMLDCHFARIDGVGHLFKEPDDKKAEFRWGRRFRKIH